MVPLPGEINSKLKPVTPTYIGSGFWFEIETKTFLCFVRLVFGSQAYFYHASFEKRIHAFNLFFCSINLFCFLTSISLLNSKWLRYGFVSQDMKNFFFSIGWTLCQEMERIWKKNFLCWVFLRDVSYKCKYSYICALFSWISRIISLNVANWHRLLWK